MFSCLIYHSRLKRSRSMFLPFPSFSQNKQRITRCFPGLPTSISLLYGLFCWFEVPFRFLPPSLTFMFLLSCLLATLFHVFLRFLPPSVPYSFCLVTSVSSTFLFSFFLHHSRLHSFFFFFFFYGQFTVPLRLLSPSLRFIFRLSSLFASTFLSLLILLVLSAGPTGFS